jgi:hypothetical protein
LISRTRHFEQAARRSGAPDEFAVREQRQKLVEKVLFTEVGLTDFAKAQLVVVALPRNADARQHGDRDLRELAEFLAKHLDWAALT